MTKFKDKTVLITGGASGIGFLMAKKAIEKRAAVIVILDINKKALEEAAVQLENGHSRISCLEADLADMEQLQNTVSAISEKGIQVDILINNAGVVTGKNFSEHSLENIERDMQVNSIAPMILTKLLLPGMVKRRSGHIINISSAASLLSNPGMSVYCAGKWALTGWSDSLRLEMERESTGIKVLTVTPYYINTGMFKGVKSPVIPILKPERVANGIMTAIEKNRIILRTPLIIYLLPLVKGILPQRVLDVVVGKFFGIYSSMKKFKGREHE